MGGWWKTPWQFVLRVKNDSGRQIVGKKRGVRVEFVVVGTEGGGGRWVPGSARFESLPNRPRVPAAG